jgi:hypothetical protein
VILSKKQQSKETIKFGDWYLNITTGIKEYFDFRKNKDDFVILPITDMPEKMDIADDIERPDFLVLDDLLSWKKEDIK